MSNAQKVYAIEPVDQARSEMYDFLATLLVKPADQAFLDNITSLKGDDSTIGERLSTLAKLAKVTTPEEVEQEFNTLFIGLGRGELLPYASYYLTGFLNEKPLAKLRGDMALLGVQRSPEKKEPEDNIASLMEMMGGFIVGRFGRVVDEAEQQRFFSTHLGPWAGLFFKDLESSKNSVFYAGVGALGRTFVEIEEEAFRMSVN